MSSLYIWFGAGSFLTDGALVTVTREGQVCTIELRTSVLSFIQKR